MNLSIKKEKQLQAFSKRATSISLSKIKEIELKGGSQDSDLISLGLGNSSLRIPNFISDHLSKVIKESASINLYTPGQGRIELRREIASYLKRVHHINSVSPEQELIVTAGCMEALAVGLSCIIDEGDEVILLSPSYSSHIEQVVFSGGVPVFVPFVESGEWCLDLDALKSSITSKTKAIVFSNPANPTGGLLTEQELRQIAELAIENSLYVVADYAYDSIVFDQEPLFSIASIEELKDRLLLTCTFSKMFALSGFRIGFAFGASALITQMLKVHDAFLHCAPSISQEAALCALSNTNGSNGKGDIWLKNMLSEYTERRSLVMNEFEKLSDFFSVVNPKGGFYSFPRILTGESSSAFAERLRSEAKVVVVPGVAFGPHGDNYLRVSFCHSKESVTKAFERIGQYLNKTV